MEKDPNNIFSHKFDHIDQLQLQKLLEYRAGKLAGKEKQQVEDFLITHEIGSEALEGLKNLSDEEILSVTHKLNQKILGGADVSQKPKIFVLPTFSIGSVAAAIVILLVSLIIFVPLIQNKMTSTEENFAYQAPEKQQETLQPQVEDRIETPPSEKMHEEIQPAYGLDEGTVPNEPVVRGPDVIEDGFYDDEVAFETDKVVAAKKMSEQKGLTATSIPKDSIKYQIKAEDLMATEAPSRARAIHPDMAEGAEGVIMLNEPNTGLAQAKQFYQMGTFKRAALLLDPIIQKDPDYTEALILGTANDLQLNKGEQAIQKLQKLLGKPNRFISKEKLLKVMELVENGEKESALSILEESLP